MYRLFKQSVANPSLLMTPVRKDFLFHAMHIYSAAAGALLANGDLLEGEWWERGELYRLFSPLAFTMEYMTHPLGGRTIIIRTFNRIQTELNAQGAIDVFESLMNRFVVEMVKPVMILNRLVTSGRLASQENPDIRLLEKNVLKQDMVVSTIMLMCQGIGVGVAEDYISEDSQSWREFIDVWQNFVNGVAFESFVSACGDAAIRMEGRAVFH